MNTKENKGITLIALVITTIVLLILVGVTIATLTGDNGILTKASEAKIKTEEKEEDELRKLTAIEASTNLKNTTYTDKNNVVVTIPKGFAVSQVEGENIVEDGLVIIDEKGNEFVWIPCTEEEYTVSDSSWQKNDTYLEREWTDTQSIEIGLESVRANGGFYIARYEAGIPENATEIYAGTNEGEFGAKRLQRNNISNIEKYTPVSQKGKQVWSTIFQENAKILAEKMVSKDTIQSYLIDSYAWNAVCRVIQKNTDKNIIDSSTWGNYYNNITTNYNSIETMFALYYYIDNNWNIPQTMNYGFVFESPRIDEVALELATGSSEDFKAYNIYDLAGNMWEWTTEESNDGRAAIRGGSFRNSGEERPAVMVNGDNVLTGYYAYNIGFRTVLYIK